MSLYINTFDTSNLINLYTQTNKVPNIILPSTITPNPDVYYPQSSISYITYQDINTDHDLRKRMTEYYIDKIINYLKYEFKKLFKYLIISDSTVRLVKNMNEYEKNISKYDIYKEKYLLDYFITREKIKYYLKKYVKKNNVNWYDLKNYKSQVINYLYTKIKKDIKRNLI
jgi:hypothetical protein